jgi:hypothetical protein
VAYHKTEALYVIERHDEIILAASVLWRSLPVVVKACAVELSAFRHAEANVKRVRSVLDRGMVSLDARIFGHTAESSWVNIVSTGVDGIRDIRCIALVAFLDLEPL